MTGYSRRCFLALLSLIFISGCTPSPSPAGGALLRQDFDALVNWNGIVADGSPGALLSTDAAHSGRYAARVGGTVKYGLGFKAPLGQLIQRRPRALEISYWGYRSDASGAGATLVCSITRPSSGKQFYWHAYNLSKAPARERTWVQVKERIELPAEANFSDVIAIYPWRGGKVGEALLDDLTLRALPE